MSDKFTAKEIYCPDCDDDYTLAYAEDHDKVYVVCGCNEAESVAEQNLSDLGYLHDDRFLVCSECDYRWTVGLPRGEPESDRWVCGACGGDFIPHFGYWHGDEFHVRPKCQDCKWVPDEPIVLDVTEAGNHDGRVQFKHHTVTGQVTDNIPHQ